jgi:hypothetical protein
MRELPMAGNAREIDLISAPTPYGIGLRQSRPNGAD